MINSNQLLEYLKRQMSEHFNQNGLNYDTEFHSEMSINSHADVDVTIKALPGNITNNRVTYPIQIYVEIVNEYFEEVNNALINFTIANNESLFTITEEDSSNIMQLFSTPTVMNLFNNNGKNYSTTVIIDGSFIVFDGAVFSNNTYVEINGQKLKGIFNTSYNNSHNCDGIVTRLSPIIDNKVNAIQVALTVDFDLYMKDELHRKLLSEADSLPIYEVKYFNGIVKRTYSMILVNLIENVPIGGTAQVKIAFATAFSQEE